MNEHTDTPMPPHVQLFHALEAMQDQRDALLAENQRLREIVQIVKQRRARFRHDVDRNDEERRLDELLAAVVEE